MIIHISGASGSGKTTLGNKLKAKFGNKIIVKDIDDLRHELILKYERTKISILQFNVQYNQLCQMFFDEFIDENKSKLIVIVGINTFINNEEERFKNHFFKVKWFLNTHANYKFYINVDTDIIIKQRWDREYNDFIDRFCDYMKRDKDIIFQEILKDEKKAKKDVCHYITEIMDFNRIKKDILRWNLYYEKSDYIFLTSEKIYNSIQKIYQEIK